MDLFLDRSKVGNKQTQHYSPQCRRVIAAGWSGWKLFRVVPNPRLPRDYNLNQFSLSSSVLALGFFFRLLFQAYRSRKCPSDKFATFFGEIVPRPGWYGFGPGRGKEKKGINTAVSLQLLPCPLSSFSSQKTLSTSTLLLFTSTKSTQTLSSLYLSLSQNEAISLLRLSPHRCFHDSGFSSARTRSRSRHFSSWLALDQARILWGRLVKGPETYERTQGKVPEDHD